MRAKDPDIGSPVRKSLNVVEDIEVVDQHTVKMKLSTSFADFPLLLTDYRLRDKLELVLDHSWLINLIQKELQF